MKWNKCLTGKQPWKGPYVFVEWLNDVVYRIQLGHRKKPKVLVHKDRLWKYSGVQDKSEDVSNRTTTQQEHQKVNSKGRAFVKHPKRRQKLPLRFRKNSQDKEACDRPWRQQQNQQGLR